MLITPAGFEALVRGERLGTRATAARAGLWWARLPYAVGVGVRNTLFDYGITPSARAAVPVVSVGNLSLGGTGKTPCVEWVAGFYRSRDVRVAILSRGYGVASGPNDEALVLEDNLPDVPHLQGADRTARAATAVEELDSELLVLDDGFQHRRLRRDLDIVLVDATEPLADDYLFPRGRLREPVSSLRRAGVVIVTRADACDCDPAAAARVADLERRWGKPVARAVHAPQYLMGADGAAEPLDAVRGRPVGAFCGLGNPCAFRRTLADLGADVVSFRVFPDHHPYTKSDVADLRRWGADLPAGGLALTTQKDFVKLRLADLGTTPLWALRVGLAFTRGEADVRARLAAVLPPRDGV